MLSEPAASQEYIYWAYQMVIFQPWCWSACRLCTKEERKRPSSTMPSKVLKRVKKPRFYRRYVGHLLICTSRSWMPLYISFMVQFRRTLINLRLKNAGGLLCILFICDSMLWLYNFWVSIQLTPLLTHLLWFLVFKQVRTLHSLDHNNVLKFYAW